MKLEYTVIRSNRRTIGLEVKPDGQVIVRVPIRLPDSEICKFVHKHEEWIQKHQEIARQRLEERPPVEKLTMQEIQELADQAVKVIPQRVAYYAPKIGVDYGRITIRNQKTRWGSCSSEGNLNFNCRLLFVPDRIVDYVVIHELAHRRFMNHSKAFWKEVEKYMPDYKEQKKLLSRFAIKH